MKRSLFATLSALTISLVAAPAFANEVEVAAVNSPSTNSIVEITPFDLVTRSYQGSFLDKGIPSTGRFVVAVNTGKLEAEDLVKAAIASGRLAPETINDRIYLNRVNAQLRNLDSN